MINSFQSIYFSDIPPVTDDIDQNLVADPIPVKPSTPEDDGAVEENKDYIPDKREASELIKELIVLSEADATKLYLSTQVELQDQLRHLHTLYELSLKHYTIETEGFFNHPLIALRNLIGSLFNKVKVLLVLSLRDFKRSEMRAWKDSNGGSYNAILDRPQYDLESVKLPYPTGMEKITYNEALNRLESFYLAIQMKSLSSRLNNDVHELIKIVNQENSEKFKDGSISNEKFIAITTIPPVDTKVISTAFLLTLDINKDAISTSKQIETGNRKLWISLFRSKKEFQEVYEKDLEMEKYLKEVSSVYSNLQDIQSSLDKFITAIENKKVEMKQEFLGRIARYIEILGELFDQYGMVNHQFHRVDHNLMEAMKELKTYFKY